MLAINEPLTGTSEITLAITSTRDIVTARQQGRLLVSRAQTVFDENGSLKDEAIRKQLEQFLNGFVQFVQV